MDLEGTDGLSDVSVGTLRSCREEGSDEGAVGPGSLCDTAGVSLWSCQGGFVVAGVRSGGVGDLRDEAEGSLGACSSERTFPLSTRGCARLDAFFANAGAGGDNDGDMEALDRSKGGEGVGALAGGLTEAVRLTCSARGLVSSLSLDEKGGEGVIEG